MQHQGALPWRCARRHGMLSAELKTSKEFGDCIALQCTNYLKATCLLLNSQKPVPEIDCVVQGR
jgi:hypothetical protein